MLEQYVGKTVLFDRNGRILEGKITKVADLVGGKGLFADVELNGKTLHCVGLFEKNIIEVK